jgi:hypothetical protein
MGACRELYPNRVARARGACCGREKQSGLELAPTLPVWRPAGTYVVCIRASEPADAPPMVTLARYSVHVVPQ